MSPEFITIRKIVTRRDTSNGIENDNIRTDDIKNFRKWHKGTMYSDIKGEVTLVNIKSVKVEDGFYDIKIQESEESFAKRLGRVIPANAEEQAE